MRHLWCSSVGTTVTIYLAIMLELGFIIGAILMDEHLFIIPVVAFPILVVVTFIVVAFIRHRHSKEAAEAEAAEETDVESQRPSSTDRGSMHGSGTGSVGSLSVHIDGHGLVVGLDYAKTLSHTDSKLVQTISSMPGVRTKFSYQELVEATNSFARKLTDAPGCAVYEGIHRNTGQRIVVKKMEYSKADTAEQQFQTELDTASVNHRCMVQLLGFCHEDSHRSLVYESMANGPLDKWIFGSKSADVRRGTLLDWSKRLRIAIEVARGLTFLHDWCQGQVVKFDIECRNIFLDENFHPKFSSFGATLKELNKLQKLRSRSLRSGSFRFLTGGSHQQVAPALPEHVAPDTIITQKSDVFSYGIVLLELVSGQSSQDVAKLYSKDETLFRSNSVARAAFVQDCTSRFIRFAPGTSPSSEIQAEQQEEEMQVSIHGMDRFVDSRLEGIFNEAEATRMVQVALWCIQKNPNMRPAMSMVVHLLEGDFDVNNCLPKVFNDLQPKV